MLIIAKVVHVAVYPVAVVATVLHNGKVQRVIKSKKTLKVSIGIVIMLTGAAMASNPVSFLPHFVWDAIAYGLHGYGALPMIKIACKKLDLEHLEEEERKK